MVTLAVGRGVAGNWEWGRYGVWPHPLPSSFSIPPPPPVTPLPTASVTITNWVSQEIGVEELYSPTVHHKDIRNYGQGKLGRTDGLGCLFFSKKSIIGEMWVNEWVSQNKKCQKSHSPLPPLMFGDLKLFWTVTSQPLQMNSQLV